MIRKVTTDGLFGRGNQEPGSLNSLMCLGETDLLPPQRNHRISFCRADFAAIRYSAVPPITLIEAVLAGYFWPLR
jgi:hypothetical protein